MGNMTPAAEFNIYFDPLGAQMVMASGLRMVMVPLEVTHTAFCGEPIRQRMSLKKSALSSILMNMIISFK